MSVSSLVILGDIAWTDRHKNAGGNPTPRLPWTWVAKTRKLSKQTGVEAESPTTKRLVSDMICYVPSGT